ENVQVSEATERLLFRAAQEALRNAARHSGASAIRATVNALPAGGARLQVADDGAGFDTAAVPDGHFGLRLLADLAHDAGGRLDVASAPGRGTTVTLELP